ncbi:MAG: hypothetical protein KDD64_04915 [Bdellovibrionales bacterium]|nr:hypothetical protein [Bdellovibrionales bacterium]
MQWYFYITLTWIAVGCVTGIVSVILTKRAWARLLIVVMVTAAIGLSFVAPFKLLGQAKPATWAWLEQGQDEAIVLGVEMIEGEGIYLMLSYEYEPHLFKFPWDPKLAEELQEAMKQAQEQGRRVVMRDPFSDASPTSPISDLIDDLLGNENSSSSGGEVGSEDAGSGDSQEGDGSGSSGEGESQPGRFYPEAPRPSPPKEEQGGGIIFPR